LTRRPNPYPPHVGTIGGKIRIGHGLTLYCENRDCRHRATLELPAISKRYGEELSVAAFMARAVCSECGARWPNLDMKVHVINGPQVVASQPK
jgi:hypothetical protein